MNKEEKTKDQLRINELNDVSGGTSFDTGCSTEKCRTEGHLWVDKGGYEQCEICGEIRCVNHP